MIQFPLFYVDTSKPPRTALVSSGSWNPIQMNDLVSGDKISMSFAFVNNGTFDNNYTKNASVTFRCAVGDFTNGLYASSSNWTGSGNSNSVTGSLDLSLGILTGSYSGAASKNCIFEFEAYDSSSNARTTLLQTAVVVWNQLLK